MTRIRHRPIRLPGKDKRELRAQFGALCYRFHKDKLQILLVTSRTRGRWIIPKGWPMHKATPADTALREAYEEAGVEGKVSGNCLGIYSYTKPDSAADAGYPRVVAVFPVRVKRLVGDFPEAGQRRRKWFSRKKAAAAVDNSELAQLIALFKPDRRNNR